MRTASTLLAISAAKLSTSDKDPRVRARCSPGAGGLLVNGLLISALALILLIKMAEQSRGQQGPLTEEVGIYYGADVQRYIAISAKTGLITAVANFAAVGRRGRGLPGRLVRVVLLPTLHP